MSASGFRYGAWSSRVNGELHPAGEELVCLLVGLATSTLALTAGETQTLDVDDQITGVSGAAGSLTSNTMTMPRDDR